jgi:hypothetical protein
MINPFKSNNMTERAKFMLTASPEKVQAAVKVAGLSSPLQLHANLPVAQSRKCSYCCRIKKNLDPCEGCGAPA